MHPKAAGGRRPLLPGDITNDEAFHLPVLRRQARIVLAQHCGGLLVISGASHGRTHPISGKNVKFGDCRVVNEVESCPLIDGEGGTDQTGSETSCCLWPPSSLEVCASFVALDAFTGGYSPETLQAPTFNHCGTH